MSAVASRRALLERAAIAGAVVAAAAPAVTAAPATMADSHPCWWREYEALEATVEDVEDVAYDGIIADQNELLRQIAVTPAHTVAGVLAQLRVVQLGMEMGEADFDAAAMANAVDTLELLAGRA